MPKRSGAPANAGPVTLGQLVENKLGLRPFCDCGRSPVIPPQDLADQPRSMSLSDFKARLTCRDCGRRGIANAHVLSMASLSAYPHITS